MDEQPKDNAAFLSKLSVKALEDLSDAAFWNYARELASTASSTPHHQEYLECSLGSRPCLIPLSALKEVLPPPHRFALLPSMPRWMLGVVAWRGETIATVDLDAYLSSSTAATHGSSSEGSLLIAETAGIPIGLVVPAIGMMTTIVFEQLALSASTGAAVLYTPRREGVVRGVYAEALVLDVPTLLADVLQQIEMATYYG